MRFAGGFGLGSEASSYSEQDRNTIILIGFETNGLLNVTNEISLVPKIRYQISGSPAPHPTGESFESILIGVGIQYELTINQGAK